MNTLVNLLTFVIFISFEDIQSTQDAEYGIRKVNEQCEQTWWLVIRLLQNVGVSSVTAGQMEAEGQSGVKSWFSARGVGGKGGMKCKHSKGTF